jgi:hypothetical protein
LVEIFISLHSEPDVGKYHLISFMENLVEKLSQLNILPPRYRNMT